MTRFWLEARAPFAAYRPLQAGAYRQSAPVMTPSAAYGLVLNLAGIESRAKGDGPTTLMREGLPALRLAIGSCSRPEVAILFQQLHRYPVGAEAGKQLRARAFGSKYQITPARREILVGLHVVLGVETADDMIHQRIASSLDGTSLLPRYGLPFAGDNNLLFDRIDLVTEPPPACWYATLDESARPSKGTCRLTVSINRSDSSCTTTALVAPSDPLKEPPADAWIWVPAKLPAYQ